MTSKCHKKFFLSSSCVSSLGMRREKCIHLASYNAFLHGQHIVWLAPGSGNAGTVSGRGYGDLRATLARHTAPAKVVYSAIVDKKTLNGFTHTVLQHLRHTQPLFLRLSSGKGVVYQVSPELGKRRRLAGGTGDLPKCWG